jgi:hypothetical protein
MFSACVIKYFSMVGDIVKFYLIGLLFNLHRTFSFSSEHVFILLPRSNSIFSSVLLI